jgi:hypothetical protein
MGRAECTSYFRASRPNNGRPVVVDMVPYYAKLPAVAAVIYRTDPIQMR